MTKYLLIAALGFILGCSSSTSDLDTGEGGEGGTAGAGGEGGMAGAGGEGGMAGAGGEGGTGAMAGAGGGGGVGGQGGMAGAGGEGGTGGTLDELCPDGHKAHPLLGCDGPAPKTPVGHGGIME